VTEWARVECREARGERRGRGRGEVEEKREREM
jgi:hypothetical protein